ncbi:MAG: hypothetical protein FWE78_03260 [Methanimicrococcus sp.]|nr:hypothetical protein [Methanimicrococcus sp.]
MTLGAFIILAVGLLFAGLLILVLDFLQKVIDILTKTKRGNPIRKRPYKLDAERSDPEANRSDPEADCSDPEADCSDFDTDRL